MEDRIQKAVELFKSGYNCSQSVVAAFADMYGFTQEQAVRMSASFGGRCGCGGGIAVRSITDNIITATVSDWGCYAMIAAIAYLKKDIDIMHTAELEGEAITAAARNGMIDMYGWCIPAIDGFGKSMNMTIVNLMRECVSYALRLEDTCKTWFEKVIDKGFFGE